MADTEHPIQPVTYATPLTAFVQNLQVMNSSYVGSRDLWWADVPEAEGGYNVYRAFDYPTNWVKLTSVPVGGHFYRDMTSLTQIVYNVQDADWIERGELGRWAFRIPDPPFSRAVVGRPVVSNDPADVLVTVSVSGNFDDAQTFRPTKVDGFDRTIWLKMDNTLPEGGAVSAFPLESNGVVWKADWSGIRAFKATYYKINNLVDIYTELNRTYYTVVPIGKSGQETHKPGAQGTVIKNSQEVDQISWEYEEMVRRNQWIFEEVGEPAYLMFRKWRGTTCGCITGLNQPKTGCRTCFEPGFVGGYIGPYDFLFVPPDSAIMRELNEGGIKTTRDSRSFLSRTPIVQNGDLIIRRNGDRNVISNVVYKQPRGIILQQDFQVTLLSPGDTRYLIPTSNALPTIFNPVVRPDPLDGVGGGEPIFDPRTVPGKDWENVNPQIGRTITFGKIQT
jgi:hypothetical protein